MPVCSTISAVVVEIHMKNSGSTAERGLSWRMREAVIPVFCETVMIMNDDNDE